VTHFLLRWLTLRFVWLIVAPFAYLLAALGVCWLIDLLDRMGALGR
jgi:hypothetical protein